MAFSPLRLRGRRVDAPLARLATRDITCIGQEILASIRRVDPAVSIELQVQASREEIHIRNSAGGTADAVSNALSGDIWLERHDKDDVMVILDSFKTSRQDGEHSRLAERVAQRLRWADKLARVQPGRMPIILSPSALATLLQPLALAFSGARVDTGSSPLAGKLGEHVFDSRLTILDDGTAAGRPGGAFDHEGVLRQRTVLVQNGVIQSYYYDLQTAARLGTKSTGNGQRELLSPPSPQSTNVIVEAGRSSLETLLREAGDGLLVDLLLGASPATALRGTFSRTVLLGFQVERGQIAGYVKGVALAGNLYEMLRNIRAISDSGYWSGDFWTPYVLVDGLSITV